MHPAHSRKIFLNLISAIFILVIQTGCERKTELALEKPVTPVTIDSSTQSESASLVEDNTDTLLSNYTDSGVNDSATENTEYSSDTSTDNMKTSNLSTDQADEQ